MLQSMEKVGASMSGSNIAVGRRARILGILTKQVPPVAIGVFAAVVTVLAIDHQRAAAPGAAAARENGVADAQALRGGEGVVRRIVMDPRGFDRIAALE